MSEQLNEHQVRIQKLHALREAGINTYVTRFERTHNTVELHELAKNQTLPTGEELMKTGAKNIYSAAGRLMMYRTHGKLSFATLQDGAGQIQVAWIKDMCKLQIGKELVSALQIDGQEMTAYKFAEKYLDLGDFIWVQGELFMTNHGELTILINEFQLLSKAVRPLGDKWHGVENLETRLRKRYLDTTMNPEVSQMLHRRSKFWQSMRSFLLEEGFMEVETPVLEVTTGGADANPFVTHHQALDIDVFLRISCGELWQKRLLVGGFEKTFEIGRIFRNEGMSPEHAQDYTQMENYRAYADYRDMMDLVKRMYLYIFDNVYGKRVFGIRGYTVDFDKPWEEIDYTTIIKEKTGIDIRKATDKEITNKLEELKVSYDPFNRIRLIDTLWKYCRKQLSGPAFLVNVPTFMSPLAKSSPTNPEVTERFQVIIAGSEVGNGFSELNDPLDQRARFTEQQELRDEGDAEAQMADREYVEALEHGMPPAAGFGVSERMFSFLENLPIREAQFFPLMKPEEGESKNEEVKNKETKIAVALLNTSLSLEPRQELNTIAHLNASFAARHGNELFTQDEVITADNHKIKLNIKHAIMIKQWGANKDLIQLMEHAKEQWVDCVTFTKEMIETTSDKKVIESTKLKNHDQVEYLGILLFWDKKIVDELTKSYSLYGSEKTASMEVTETTEYGTLPTLDQAHALVDEYLTETKRHCLQVGNVMESFAKRLGEDTHLRYLAGLLHDIDWDHIAKDGDKHLKDEFEKIMDKIHAPQALRDDIKSHGERLTGVPVNSTIRKYLASIDELSGFIHAYSLMRPTGLEGMDVAGVKKRMKDKKFAAGVDREHVMNCEKYLGISFDEFAGQVIEAMQAIK